MRRLDILTTSPHHTPSTLHLILLLVLPEKREPRSAVERQEDPKTTRRRWASAAVGRTDAVTKLYSTRGCGRRVQSRRPQPIRI